MPVMVCMDGFILTHAYERLDIPSQDQVDAYLPPYDPRQVLDPAEPVSIGAMVGPEAFMEVRYLAHAKQTMALNLIPQIAAEFDAVFGRAAGGLVRGYRIEDAETIVVALGSVVGTLEAVSYTHLDVYKRQVLATDARLSNITLNWNEPNRVVRVVLDQEKLRQLGLTQTDVAQALYGLYDGIQVTELRDGRTLIDVIGRGTDADRSNCLLYTSRCV